MNFDMSDTESALSIEIKNILEACWKVEDLEGMTAAGAGGHLRELMSELSKTSYLRFGWGGGVSRPEGADLLMPAMEALSSVTPSLFLAVEYGTRIFGGIIFNWGGGELRERFRAPIMEGRVVGAVALSETATNVENDPMKTTGIMAGGQVVINGLKNYVVNGPVADWTAVAGILNGQNVFFLVERGTEGIVDNRLLKTVGYDGTAIGGFQLRDCRIPVENVITPADGREALGTVRLWENQVIIGASLGMMKASIDHAASFAKSHKTGGKPIIVYQEVAFKIAEMMTLYHISKLMACRAEWVSREKGPDRETLMLCTKVFCSEAAETVASHALQCLGAAGYMAGNPAERAFRNAKYGQIAGTSSEIARKKIGDDSLAL